GGFQLQTAEFAKLATAMALAKFISTHGVDIRNWRDRMISFAFILLPCLIVLLQNDTGSAIVFFAFIFVLYRQGISVLYLIIPIIVAVISLSVLVAGIKPVLIGVGVVAVVGYLIVRR